MLRSQAIRRRAIIGSRGYALNALAAHFDGINNAGREHDLTAVRWSDISGNNKTLPLIMASSPEWGEDHISFNSGAQNSSWIHIPVVSEYTFEYLIWQDPLLEGTAQSNFYTICGSYSSNFNFYATPSSIHVRVKGVRNQFAFNATPNVPHLMTIVVIPQSGLLFYCDGMLIESRSSNIPTLTNLQLSLGFNGGVNASPKGSCKLYACRIYTRALSGTEVTQNYYLDKERYNL